MTNDTAGQHQLLWYHRTGTDTDGWSERESEFFLPGRDDHGSVLLYLEFPGWCGVESWDWAVSVGDGEPLSYQVTSGYYSLRLPLCEGSETRIRFTASADFELSSNDRRRSYRVAGVALGPVCAEGLTQLQGIESVQLEKAPVGYEWVEAGVWEFVQRNLAYLSFSPIQEEPGCEKILWHGREVGRTGSIESLRGKFGEDCFIVASGPSVSDIDFSLLKDKTLFAVNGAIVLQQNENVQFDLYVAVDPEFAIHRISSIRRAVKLGAICFFSAPVIVAICTLDPHILAGANLNILPCNLKSSTNVAAEEIGANKNSPPLYFSRNIKKDVCTGGTVAYVAIQVCYSLGIRRIYMLGVDFMMTDKKSHFYEQAEHSYHSPRHYRKILERTFSERVMPAFGLLTKISSGAHDNFSVFNLSENSRLPASVIPKISLNEAVRKSTGNARP